MLDSRNSMVWLIGVLTLGIIFFLLRGRFNAETRARRRREKSNRPVISRKKDPTVKLAVNAGKPRGDRKG
jgi:hypothetical protein